MWNPFKRELPREDSTFEIFIGQRSYPLICDPQMYDAGIAKIQSILRTWISSELSLAQLIKQDMEHHLIQSLRQLNVKFLAHDTLARELDRILTDTATNISGSRFMDTVLYIFMSVPQEVLDTITGRFLAGVLYYLPSEINDVSMPTKEDWLNLLSKHTWLPLLPIYQDVFDTDDVIKRITEMVNKERSRNTTVVRTTQTPAQ